MLALRKVFNQVTKSLSQISFMPPSSPTTPIKIVCSPKTNNLTILSESPLILINESFLDPQSCQQIIQAAQLYGNQWSSPASISQDIKYELPSFPLPAGFKPTEAAQLLEDTFQEIDNIIGCSRTSVDVNPKVHHYPRSDDSKLSLPSGLHVDVNARPKRYATAILYLTSLNDTINQGNGATVFPAASNENDSVKEAANYLIQRDLLHTDHAIANGDEQDIAMARLLLKEAHSGTSIVPKVGKLLIFFTCDDDGEVDPLTWHGADAVNARQQTEDKWTLQIFKELPFGVSKFPFVQEKRERIRKIAKSCAVCC